MPKMKPPLAQRLAVMDAKRIRNDILGGLHDTGITKQRLAEEIGVSKNTLLRKLKMPEKFTLGELLRIWKTLDGGEANEA